MLFGEQQVTRDDQVVLAAQTSWPQVQQLIDQGQWEQAQDKLVALRTTVQSVETVDEQARADRAVECVDRTRWSSRTPRRRCRRSGSRAGASRLAADAAAVPVIVDTTHRHDHDVSVGHVAADHDVVPRPPPGDHEVSHAAVGPRRCRARPVRPSRRPDRPSSSRRPTTPSTPTSRLPTSTTTPPTTTAADDHDGPTHTDRPRPRTAATTTMTRRRRRRRSPTTTPPPAAAAGDSGRDPGREPQSAAPSQPQRSRNRAGRDAAAGSDVDRARGVGRCRRGRCTHPHDHIVAPGAGE